MSIMLWIPVGIASTSFLYYEYPKFDYRVATFEDDRIVYHPHGLFCWEFDSRCVNIPTYAVGAGGHVSAITVNPKVRPIHYRLTITISAPERFYRTELRRTLPRHEADGEVYYDMEDLSGPPDNRKSQDGWNIDKEMAKQVIYEMYEFNNQHSKQLAEFWNPLDPEQQKGFEALIIPWMNARPGIQSQGLTIGFQDFYFRDQ